VITVATLFWQANDASYDFSRMYDETWVEKLYRGFARNLTRPFRFVCFTDRPREFCEPIEQEPIRGRLDYSACIEPYRLGEPMILVGLDTVVTGNCDALADYCLTADRLAVPRDPYDAKVVCNGVALVPAGHGRIATEHDGKTNDMEWIRLHRPAILDDLFPGPKVASYKVHVKPRRLGDTRICYFHGEEKPHQIAHNTPWVREHWR
jgi:hypothetical protein